MRILFSLLLVVPLGLWAQPDGYHSQLLTSLQQTHNLTGGTWLLPPNEATLIPQVSTYGCTRQDLPVSGQSFTQAIQLTIPAAGTNPWDAGMVISAQSPVQFGDRVLVTVWLRAPSGSGSVTLFVEDASTFEKEVYLGLQLDSTWQQIFIAFESGKAYSVGDMNLGFHLAHQAQTIEIAGMNALNYGKSYPLQALPVQFPVRYPGDEPGAPWRTAAAARIEQHRKANLNLTLLDGQGQPLASEPVRVRMLRHQFGFGTAVTPLRLAGNSNHDATYAQHLLDLDGEGHGFNLVVTENALKWRAWEQGWAGSPAETMNALEWLRDQEVSVRGHVLLWPGWTRMPNDMQTNSQDPTYLQNRIAGHLSDILNRPTIQEIIREWDVINEITHVRDLEYALAGQPGYPTGREIYPWVMQGVESEDPALLQYLNDYDILSNGSVQGASYQLFKQMIQEIIAGGGKVDGIGFQAHMTSLLVAPDSLYAILEDCYQTFSLPIKITEYDLPKELPDGAEAKYLADFLTLVFSHPTVDGFLMWGFWDGAHWKENAPLYYEDWSPKPAHATFVDLVFDQWWTDTTLTTNPQGHIDLRGFKGTYEVEASGLGLSSQLHLGADLQDTLQLQMVNIDDPQASFRVYPQPADQSLWIESSDARPWTYTILDPRGRVVKLGTVRTASSQIPLSDLPVGLYLLRAEAPGRPPMVEKVLISR